MAFIAQMRLSRTSKSLWNQKQTKTEKSYNLFTADKIETMKLIELSDFLLEEFSLSEEKWYGSGIKIQKEGNTVHSGGGGGRRGGGSDEKETRGGIWISSSRKYRCCKEKT